MKKTTASALKFLIKLCAVILGIATMSVLTAALFIAKNIPDSISVTEGSQAVFNTSLPIKSVVDNKSCVQVTNLTKAGQHYSEKIMLFGTVPVKKICVTVVKNTTVVPCGSTFGVKFYTDGVVIVGMSDVDTKDGPKNPAYSAGIRTGDVILAINGKSVCTNDEVAKIFSQSNGKLLSISLKRGNVGYSVSFRPVKSVSSNEYKAGLWVRDSTAGIGTITFYNPDTMVFGGLGHGICDVDTGKIMPLMTGNVVKVNMTGIKRGSKGEPGELQGTFSDTSWGSLLSNTEEGVFGVLNSAESGQAIPVAMRQEVRTGPAEIIATVDNNGPKKYSVDIERLNYNSSVLTKNMVLKVTDKTLIAKTGGIVQGMSGSPIIQNGKLVGAVTHVFVNEPECGYGIFAENMIDIANSFENLNLKNAS